MKKTLFFLSLLSPFILYSQMEVDNTQLISDLVSDSLVGDNISISNVTYNGESANVIYTNVGAFNASNSNIPFSSGLVLATGNSEFVIGPNNGNISTNGDAPQYTDVDIDSIITANTGAHDLSVLEFDFIPTGNFISMEFVFSSEEYNEYVCAQFNDAFGIFLSGPGIDGPYSNSGINIALIPQTELPVSINTINNGNVGEDGNEDICSIQDLANSEYFIDNEDNLDTTSTQMDGFTVPILLSSDVQSGETYHLKIAIADAADDNFDSAVFLKSNSLNVSTFDPLGVKEDINKYSFNVYPNPSNGIFNVETNDLTNASIKVFNLNGKQVYFADGLSGFIHVIQLNEPKGMYILELNSNGERQYYKLVNE